MSNRTVQTRISLSASLTGEKYSTVQSTLNRNMSGDKRYLVALRTLDVRLNKFLQLLLRILSLGKLDRRTANTTVLLLLMNNEPQGVDVINNEKTEKDKERKVGRKEDKKEQMPLEEKIMHDNISNDYESLYSDLAPGEESDRDNDANGNERAKRHFEQDGLPSPPANANDKNHFKILQRARKLAMAQPIASVGGDVEARNRSFGIWPYGCCGVFCVESDRRPHF